jgi:hypothetical protein
MICSVLTLDRQSNELWIDKRGHHETVIFKVTGLERVKGYHSEVRLLYKGSYRGLVWNVSEIKEKW